MLTREQITNEPDNNSIEDDEDEYWCKSSSHIENNYHNELFVLY